MKCCLASVSAVALVLCAANAFAQQKATAQNVPEIRYTSVPNFLKVPPGEYLGESVGGRDQFQGPYLRLPPQRQHAAVGVRSERQLRQGDRQGLLRLRIRALRARRCRRTTSGRSTKARTRSRSSVPQGKFLMVLGRRPPAVDGVVATPTGPNPPAQKYMFCRPTDVGSIRKATSSCPTATATTAW